MTIALLAVALGPVLIVIGKVVSAVGTIMTIVPKVTGVIKTVKTTFAALNTTMLANPITLIIAAIAALVAAFIYLWNNCDGFREFWINLWENVKEVAIAVWNAIKEFFSAAWEAISSTAQAVWNGIKDFFSGLWEGIKSVYSDKEKHCETPHVTEEEIKVAFVSAYNQLLTEKKEIIANAEIIRKTLCRTDALEQEKHTLEDEMNVVAEMTQSIIAENARVVQDQEEYQKRYNGLVERYDTAKARYDEVAASISAKEAQNERLANFIKVLKAQDGTISEFDGRLWGSMAEFVTVGRKKEITVTFRDGTEIMA